jgi:hypothetical protein
MKLIFAPAHNTVVCSSVGSDIGQPRAWQFGLREIFHSDKALCMLLLMLWAVVV